MGNRCMGIQTLNPFRFRYGKQVYGYTCSHPNSRIAHPSSIHVLVNQVSSGRFMCMQSWVAPCMRSCFGNQHVLMCPAHMHAMQSHLL